MTIEELEVLENNIENKTDFFIYLNAFKELYIESNGDLWENPLFNDYIEGCYGFSLGIAGYYKNTNQNIDIEKITWKMAAKIITSGSSHS
jgi:hypothetical protein